MFDLSAQNYSQDDWPQGNFKPIKYESDNAHDQHYSHIEIASIHGVRTDDAEH